MGTKPRGGPSPSSDHRRARILTEESDLKKDTDEISDSVGQHVEVVEGKGKRNEGVRLSKLRLAAIWMGVLSPTGEWQVRPSSWSASGDY